MTSDGAIHGETSTARDTAIVEDPYRVERAWDSGGLLGLFNVAGLLSPADVHVARRLAMLASEDSDGPAALAAAFAVRGPRYGHVYVDLATVAATASDGTDVDVDPTALPWPDPDQWVAALRASATVAAGDDAPARLPLRLVGSALYLDRNWSDERAVAAHLLARAGAPAPEVDAHLLVEGLDRLFPDEEAGGTGSGGGGRPGAAGRHLGAGGAAHDDQRRAVAAAVGNRLAVIAGGPGTGKTTCLARALALIIEQAEAAGTRLPLVALAAPTGKAAARLQEALQNEARHLAVSPTVRRHLQTATAVTLHRLLGNRPGSGHFTHNQHNRLPHDVVMVDETSMVALWLMARLTAAVRDDARLVLAGDPRQLASVEAGAVLGDVVGPADDEPTPDGPPGRRGSEESRTRTPMASTVVVLTRGRRFAGAIAELADAIRRGSGDEAVGVLGSGRPDLRWVGREGAPPTGQSASAQTPATDGVTFSVSHADAGQPVSGVGLPAPAVDVIRQAVVEAGRQLFVEASAGEAAGALSVLNSFRLLCGHRQGPYGVCRWNQLCGAWLAQAVAGFTPGPAWYVGRPVMVTVNDYGLGLHNGDTGVAVASPDQTVSVAFPGPSGVKLFSPWRMGSLETVYAMTIHKAQGSEFDDVVVILPPVGSPILTRELLYTAATRARRGLTLAGSEEALRQAVARPIARASGLTRRLWS
jgi:exodeoxyribonuclease V alpha subunit